VSSDTKVLTADDLAVGMRAEFEREVTVDDVLAFAANSGDRNPLHVDAEYARATRFENRIAHGALQIGLASALLGMHLPGRNVLLGSVQARFTSPLYFPCPVVVSGEIIAWDREARSGTVKVVVQDAARKVPTAEIFMGFTMHEQREESAARPRPAAAPFTSAAGKPVVIVTGGAGGIGAPLIERLAADYRVLALVNRHALPAALSGHPDVREVPADLGSPDWARAVEAVLGDATAPVYGIVHAAWPGAPRGGLLDASEESVQHQVQFGTTYTVRLARFLFGRVGPDGGRFIVVGSIFGNRQPSLSVAAYSLGKATLESTIRLLAPELARRRITANAVCPGVLPVGMNKHQNERWHALKAARVPLGRLCEPDDVISLVGFLLSPGGAFISGEAITVSGGEL
jgi:NAD(P)-dependent dehydrogenase (short-subunit alcohol dehydrogenase family)/acyl dehydratase